MTARLDPRVFRLPVADIRRGFYTDAYFTRTRRILQRDGHHPRVLMQVFTRSAGIVCGADEAIAVLKLCADKPSALRIRALRDGDPMRARDTVMTIEGDYATFAHLETVYLGILGRRSAVATNVREVVEAASGKPVFFFSARFDHLLNQPGDGWAAKVGGAAGVSTDANAALWRGKGIGTIPHGLIAAYEGDTVAATEAFDRHIQRGVNRIALVDWDNDCVGTALACARALGRRLWAVRLDTSGDLRDRSVRGRGPASHGVCAELVRKVRAALNENGFRWVKIVVSGGFTAEKLKRFVKDRVPFDVVGVGSALFRGRIDFTADIVQVNGRPCAKVGRALRPNPRLRLVS
ncbi:MAG: nicotinate phosphoribosyltransferase [Verrucomicrobia bacterium]|nr:nicotinate phosphoribosyltransferase [Verrucomicrobiota bacterium]